MSEPIDFAHEIELMGQIDTLLRQMHPRGRKAALDYFVDKFLVHPADKIVEDDVFRLVAAQPGIGPGSIFEALERYGEPTLRVAIQRLIESGRIEYNRRRGLVLCGDRAVQTPEV